MFGRKENKVIKKWEYKVEEANVLSEDTYGEQTRFANFEHILNKMGQEGWELASTDLHIEARKPTILIFKRPKNDLSVAFLKQPRQKI